MMTFAKGVTSGYQQLGGLMLSERIQAILAQTTPVDQLETLPHMLKQIVEDHGQKFVRAGFAAFTATAYEFALEFDSPTAVFQDMYDARHAVGLGVIACLNENGIALAYPTQTALSAAEAGMIIDTPGPQHEGPPRCRGLHLVTGALPRVHELAARSVRLTLDGDPVGTGDRWSGQRVAAQQRWRAGHHRSRTRLPCSRRLARA